MTPSCLDVYRRRREGEGEGFAAAAAASAPLPLYSSPSSSSSSSSSSLIYKIALCLYLILALGSLQSVAADTDSIQPPISMGPSSYLKPDCGGDRDRGTLLNTYRTIN